MTGVDVVIVSFNSAATLTRCVTPLAGAAGVGITVVDNASHDGTLDLLATLPVTTVALDWNSGFSHGCNTGAREGSAPYILFLNPDAAIDVASLEQLAAVLDADPRVGIAAPRISYDSGELSYSLRFFPSLSRAYAQAFFVHRFAGDAAWADEVIRDPAAYERRWSPEWVSGACLLIRRSLFEQIGGFDERFFLYSEDVDLCRRVREAGFDVRYEPDAHAVHTGGASAPRGAALPRMAKARRQYALKHEGSVAATAFAVAGALSSLTHVAVERDGDRRRGHLRSVGASFTRAD